MAAQRAELLLSVSVSHTRAPAPLFPIQLPVSGPVREDAAGAGAHATHAGDQDEGPDPAAVASTQILSLSLVLTSGSLPLSNK